MRTVGRALARASVLLAGLGVVLAGCGRPSYQFLGNDDRDLVMRLPVSWSKIDPDDVARATGQDPSTTVGWTAVFDGSAKPSVKHASAAYADAPLMIVRSVDVPQDQRDGVTADALRDLVIPVTEQARTEQQLTAAAAGQQPPVFKLLKDTTLTTKTERGVHLIFSYAIGGHTEVYDKVAVTDPKKTRVHIALAHCSQACYSSRGKEIDTVISSLTVKD